jgi:hypothetical protein
MHPKELSIKNKFQCEDEERVWSAASRGGIIFEVEFMKKDFQEICYKEIIFKPRRIIFKDDNLCFQLLLHNDLMFRTI